MLLRLCAPTFNTHRIHYDQPYATGVERYPAVVENGSLTTRNLRPLFRDRTNQLPVSEGEPWLLWAEDDAGAPALEARIA